MPSRVPELDARTDATAVLEAGDVLWQRRGFFLIQEREQPLFSPAVLASGKNVSFDPATRRVGGSSLTGDLSHALQGMLARFSDESHAFLMRACPRYASRLSARTHEFPARRNRGPRVVVAQGRHAASRRRVSGDAGARPADLARVREREPGGASRDRGASGTASTPSRGCFAPKLRLPLPGVERPARAAARHEDARDRRTTR